jgi:hypothetical protein
MRSNTKFKPPRRSVQRAACNDGLGRRGWLRSEATARFHQPCHAEWLAQQEGAARRAMGLDRNRCAQQDPDGVCARVPQ